jgi:hypothetical protein
MKVTYKIKDYAGIPGNDKIVTVIGKQAQTTIEDWSWRQEEIGIEILDIEYLQDTREVK